MPFLCECKLLGILRRNWYWVNSNTFNVAFLLDFITLFSVLNSAKVLHVESRKINPDWWSNERWKRAHFTNHQFHCASWELWKHDKISIHVKAFSFLLIKLTTLAIKGKMLKLHRFSNERGYWVTCNAPKWITSAKRNLSKSLKNQRLKIYPLNTLKCIKNFHPLCELNYWLKNTHETQLEKLSRCKNMSHNGLSSLSNEDGNGQDECGKFSIFIH